MEYRVDTLEPANGSLGVTVRRREAAQGLVEYGLAVGVVGVLAIAALQRWGTEIGQLFERLSNLIRPIGG